MQRLDDYACCIKRLRHRLRSVRQMLQQELLQMRGPRRSALLLLPPPTMRATMPLLVAVAVVAAAAAARVHSPASRGHAGT
jgi:hypothetical protein